MTDTATSHSVKKPIRADDYEPPTEPLQFYDRVLPSRGDYVYLDETVALVTCATAASPDSFTYVFALVDPFTLEFLGIVRVPDTDGIPTAKQTDWIGGPPADDTLVGTWDPAADEFTPA